jgi:hypothetical protein
MKVGFHVVARLKAFAADRPEFFGGSLAHQLDN